MKVKELIEFLEHYDDDETVIIETHDGSLEIESRVIQGSHLGLSYENVNKIGFCVIIKTSCWV